MVSVPMAYSEVNPSLTLIGGGVRSGKSAHALRVALSRGAKRTFIATAQALDDEMTQRAERHRQERGEDFTTLEAPHDLEAAVRHAGAQDSVVVDCVTLWLSNRLIAQTPPSTILAELDGVLAALRDCPAHFIFVTNEVGMGIVPESKLGRVFRDLSGYANQRLARCAGTVYLASMGLILRLRPDPVALVSTTEMTPL